MREHLSAEGYSQIPQLSSMNPIDVNNKFDLVPEDATGTRRAVMIGINYVGEQTAGRATLLDAWSAAPDSHRPASPFAIEPQATTPASSLAAGTTCST